MKPPIVCPACNATNKPKAVTCRVCGERLVARREKPDTKAPVVLQRVMTGEVFSAVIVPGQEGTRLPARPRSVLDEAPATSPRKPPPEPPEPAGLTDPEVARLLRDVLARIQRAEFADAITLAERILRERPDDPKALIVKGDALFRSGRREEASEVFDDLVRVNPKNAKVWLDRARIRKTMDDYPEALRSYDAALAIDENLADGWYERATVLETLGDAREALRSVARAVELKPDHRAAVTLKIDLERRAAQQAVQAVAASIDQDLAELEDRAGARAPESEALPPPPPPEPEVAVRVRETPVPTPSRPAALVRPKGRIYTYVDGLDEALNGGLPEGHVVIVAGPPGTLKSSLCLSVAANNAARERRPVLYITLEESRESFSVQARSLGLPIEEAGGLLTVLEARDFRAEVPRTGEDWVDAFAAVLATLRVERPFEILILDALEGLEAIARFTDRRRAIFRLFEHLRSLGVTTLVVAERPDVVVHGNVVYGRWAEDFLADGILHLRQHLVSDVEVQRRVRIVKMRGTRHETGYMALLVDDGRLRATRAMAQ